MCNVLIKLIYLLAIQDLFVTGMASTGKKILKYPEEDMAAAIISVREGGLGIKKAARQFNVPKTTLRYKVRGIYPEKRRMGPDTIFSEDEEKLLATWVLDVAKAGFPVSKENFLVSVTRLSKELKKEFKHEVPGRKWYEGFLKRHPNISLRVSQNLTKSRSAVTPEKLHNWFTEVENYLQESQNQQILSDPTRMFNMDESAFFLNPKGSKVLAKRGDKTVYNTINNDEKECLTVLLTGSAAGVVAPPLVLFRYKRIPSEICNSIPKDWGVGCSDSGWMTCDTFYSYIANIFYPWAKDNTQFPIILFVDGHSSHFSYHLSEFCKKVGIILIALYPNSTHLLQPMDVAVFKTLKASWKEHVLAWRVEHQAEVLKRHNFAPLLKSSISKVVTPKVLQSGFRKCGLFPWDPTSVDKICKITSSLDLTGESRPTPEKPTSIQRKNEEHLVFFESFIEKQKLQLFKSVSEEQPWTGPLSDSSLFEVWNRMQLEVREHSQLGESIASRTPTVNTPDSSFMGLDLRFQDIVDINGSDIMEELNFENLQTYDIISDVQDEGATNIIVEINHEMASTSFAKDSENTQMSSSTNPDIDLPILITVPFQKNEQSAPIATSSPKCLGDNGLSTPHKTSSLVSVASEGESGTEKAAQNLKEVIPSPFKRALFWPEPKVEVLKKRKTEKIPSVVTSLQWQEYNKKKSEEKERKLKEKEDKKKQKE